MEKTEKITDESLLQLYMKQIAGSKPLTAQQEARLSAQIRKGSRRALEAMVVANLRFVVSVAKNYEHQGLHLADLINEGNLGLIRAAKRFDEKKNFKFISYAVWWVRQSILQALAEQSRIVKVPLNRAGAIYKIGRALKKLEQKYRRTPSLDEIANELSMSRRQVTESVRLGEGHMSLDAPVGDGGEVTRMDVVGDEKGYDPDEHTMQMSLQEELDGTLRELSQRERQILRLYFGLEDDVAYTLDEIGERLRLTRERTRQIKETALKRLRASPGCMRLRAYVA